MQKKILRETKMNGKFGITSASRIVDIKYLEDNYNYEVEYIESPFDGELDVYEIYFLHDNNTENVNFDKLKGYKFYGKYWDTHNEDYFSILCKQVDRVVTRNKIKE